MRWDDTYHPLAAQAAQKRQSRDKADAMKYLIGFPEDVVNDINNSTSNDGLVPVTDQFDPNIGSTVTNLGGRPIDANFKVAITSVNHFYARFAKENWGSEGYANVGFDKNKVGQDGNIRNYLFKLGYPPSVEATNQRWDMNPGRP